MDKGTTSLNAAYKFTPLETRILKEANLLPIAIGQVTLKDL